MKRARNASFDEVSRRALAAAAEWRLVGLLLERPRGDWGREVARLAADIRDPELQEAAEAARDASEGAYLAVLGPGGPVASRIVGYRRFSDPGWVLSSLTQFYDAFAFRPRSEDPIDHMAVAAQFVGYLFLKEAFARSAGESEAVAVTTRARERFIEEHLQQVAEPFALQLGTSAPNYLVRAARAMARRVPAPLPEPASPCDLDDDSDATMCGACLTRAD